MKELEPIRIHAALIISLILNGFLLSRVFEGWQAWGSVMIFGLVIIATITKTREVEDEG